MDFLALWPYWGLALVVCAYAYVDYLRPAAVNSFEEGFISLILALMVMVSFGQVVARYGFNTGWGAALEFVRVLFAWLILFGMSYVVKINAHLGVDAVIRLFPKPAFRAFAVIGALTGVLFGIVLLTADWLQLFGANTKGGAIFYWAKFYKIGLGMEDIAWPLWAQEAFGWQDRVPRWIPYLILPLGLGLFTFRCLQATIQIIRGDREMMIAAHEAEDLVAENQGAVKD